VIENEVNSEMVLGWNLRSKLYSKPLNHQTNPVNRQNQRVGRAKGTQHRQPEVLISVMMTGRQAGSYRANFFLQPSSRCSKSQPVRNEPDDHTNVRADLKATVDEVLFRSSWLLNIVLKCKLRCLKTVGL
jgi:hypothetical protein